MEIACCDVITLVSISKYNQLFTGSQAVLKLELVYQDHSIKSGSFYTLSTR